MFGNVKSRAPSFALERGLFDWSVESRNYRTPQRIADASRDWLPESKKHPCDISRTMHARDSTQERLFKASSKILSCDHTLRQQ
jgi:hypothetical protein